MRVPESLSQAFKTEFEPIIARFAVEKGLIPEIEALRSDRFISRSIVPHVQKLSALFNREEGDQASGLDRYWKDSSNPAHLRMAYFLYFMPCNLFRVASVWCELSRLGFRWPEGQPLSAIEFGAGPAAGAAGIVAGESFLSAGLPGEGTWALIEQDKAMLQLGSDWLQRYCEETSRNWGVRTFHRKVDVTQGLLPRGAPRFNLWVMSYFLNESRESPETIAHALLEAWDRHLSDEGIVIIVEPALKAQSRKLLEIRQELLKARERKKADWLQVLLPCLGHQACGALAQPEDWCHEEVSWWRPEYFRAIDRMAHLDRKTLPFSYLVLTKSRRPRREILSALGSASTTHRLVSPSHSEGRDLEFFICGQDGKKRARYRPASEETLERGDILIDAEVRGDAQASRIDRAKKAK